MDLEEIGRCYGRLADYICTKKVKEYALLLKMSRPRKLEKTLYFCEKKESLIPEKTLSFRLLPVRISMYIKQSHMMPLSQD